MLLSYLSRGREFSYVASQPICNAKVQLFFKLPKLFSTFCINTLI
nr:MAG TPA: hypothetical protein [Caudoviricetes sp.]